MRLATLALLMTGCIGDPDGDGLSMREERELHTDPYNADSDGDGVTDGVEVESALDPNNPDTDQDGLRDGTELDLGLDPHSSDSDGDGLNDLTEYALGSNPSTRDTDLDGLEDGAEINRGTKPAIPDTDGDSMNDGDEIEAGTDPNDPDTDSDGLRDGDERNLGTDPLKPDSDTDGFNDGDEDASGSDPNDRFSWDYDGGVWPDRSELAAQRLNPTGYAIGDVIPDLTMIDQNSRYFTLHQFFGYVTRLDLLWAGDPASEEVGDEARTDWAAHRSEGYITVHALFKRSTVVTPISEVIPEWAATKGIDFPVGGGGEADIDDRFEASGLFNGRDALTVLIDRKMVIRGAWVNGDLSGFDASLDALLHP
ncbi:MAG TPA: hypothetical protein PKA64_21225 [Myxococcota bacterium]|nr:hypothetical protein [Myxococcota bacterium]